MEKAHASGLVEVREVRGLGRKICCLEPDNIVICGIQVDATFDIARPDHVDNLFHGGLKAKCRKCGAKFWTDKDKSTLMDRQ